MERMVMIHPGMTREALLKVLTTEGGLSTRLQRKFVSPVCPNLKITVDFRAEGDVRRDEDGRLVALEDLKDVITAVSKPYFQHPIYD